MLDFGFYNMDCLDGMCQFPDGYFDLAIVDPPYGDGGGQWSGAERFGGNFDKYRNSGGGYKSNRAEANTDKGATAKSRTEHGVTRIGGTWARKYGKKSLRGMLHRGKSILTSFSASHARR